MKVGAGNTRIWKRACLCAISDGVPRRSLYIALVVGTVLPIIQSAGGILRAGRCAVLFQSLQKGGAQGAKG